MPVKQITADDQLAGELTAAGSKLVVVDFFATWCGPCQRISPFFSDLSNRNPNAVFLKVDVDQCQQSAVTHSVSAMPTFVFFRNQQEIDRLRGASPEQIEVKVKEHAGVAVDAEEAVVAGHVDLVSFLNKAGSECLNQADDHVWENALSQKGGYLESDTDEQLLLTVAFNQPIKLHSLMIQGPDDKGPKTLKLFINPPTSIDFDAAESMEPVQQIDLKPDDLKNGTVVNLRYVKFQNVQSLTIFFKDNQEETETTQINYIGFFGSPVNQTNMNEFKRVAGKKGEAH